MQGIGAALLTPQTLSTITRIFPAQRRGAAMSVWGATAGVATLVGPLAGGVLVDHLGWQWIFFVNVPIGIIGLALGYWLIPVLPTQRHRFDVLGVLLSGAAMFLVVFGLQEGESRQWPMWIWATIAAGVVLMVVFVYWQAVNKHEPLIPLRIFRDRDFSLANVGVAVIGFAVTSMIVPVMFYAQVVSGLSPTRSALLTAPMAVMSGVLAPLVGKIVDRAHPRTVIGFGFSVLAIALTWLSIEMTPTTPIWRLLLPFLMMGVGMAFIWAPLAATATRHLPPDLAGAGSGVYNATRQVGSVLGSAGIAAFMTSRISAEMPGGQTRPAGQAAMQLPDFLREPFSAALSQSMLLPAFIALFGVIAALFMVGMVKPAATRPVAAPTPTKSAKGEKVSAAANARTEIIPLLPDDTLFDSPYRREFTSHPNLFGEIDYDDVAYGLGGHPEGYIDDDEDGYVEYLITLPVTPETVGRTPAKGAEPGVAAPVPYVEPDDRDTEPLATRVEHPRPAPAESWHSAPVESWHSTPDDVTVEDVARQPVAEPIGFAHNGFHVDENNLFQPLPPPSTMSAEILAPPTGSTASRTGSTPFRRASPILWSASVIRCRHPGVRLHRPLPACARRGTACPRKTSPTGTPATFAIDRTTPRTTAGTHCRSTTEGPGQRRRQAASRQCQDAPRSTSPSGVPGRYSVRICDWTTTAAYCARLTATFSRFLLSRNEIPRGTSSIDDAVIEKNTTGACWPWNLSTVPARTSPKAGPVEVAPQHHHLRVVRRDDQQVARRQRPVTP